MQPFIKAGHRVSGPFRGLKRDAWEGGHHMPFVVSWPGVIKPESQCAQQVSLNDIMATCAQITGAKLPDNAAEDIIVIYTDDHGYADLGCMGLMADVKTPNIDKLASGGVLMTSGYVTAPQCSPSRCGVIGGQYQGKYGMDHNGMLCRWMHRRSMRLQIRRTKQQASRFLRCLNRWS